jgi:hypothetical protein
MLLSLVTPTVAPAQGKSPDERARQTESQMTDDERFSMSLPWGQDALIDALATANPNTIVVLETGNPVSMPWRNKVKAIV